MQVGDMSIVFEDKGKKVEVQLKEETIWLTLNQIAYLFDVQKAAISKHIKNIFNSGELLPNSTVSKMETVQTEGKRSVRRKITYYNLDMIIAVGYRVNSRQATRFRIWATNVLKNYLVKGYAVHERRLTRERLRALEDAIRLMKENISTPSLTAREAKGEVSLRP